MPEIQPGQIYRWADGIKPYGRGDEWLDSHRFDFNSAMDLAQAAAPHVTVNGHSVAEALARTKEHTP